jgi:hypothetical protein
MTTHNNQCLQCPLDFVPFPTCHNRETENENQELILVKYDGWVTELLTSPKPTINAMPNQ